MKTEPKSNFSQQLNCQQQDRGFTLIELLVVIFITGILSAVAVPHFLNNVTKAKQSEGRQNIFLVNKAQNAYRAEKQQFASTFNLLAIGSIVDSNPSVGGAGTTTDYNYMMTGIIETASVLADPKDGALKAYTGRAQRFNNSEDLSIIRTILCENITNGGSTTTPPNAVIAPTENLGAAPTCAAGQTSVSI